MYFHVYLIYRFTRTFTDHSSVITRCWGFELQNGKSSLKSPQTLAAQDFAPASFLSTPDKKHRKLQFSVLFCCKNAENGVGQNVGQLPDPHRDPHAEMRGKSQRAPERKLLPFRCSACLWDLSNLRHEAAHFLCGLLLHLPCDVGVGTQREACIIVTQHTADRFHIHAIL